jgi:hypothetical protein
MVALYHIFYYSIIFDSLLKPNTTTLPKKEKKPNTSWQKITPRGKASRVGKQTL